MLVSSRSHLVVDDARHWRSHCGRQREEREETPDGLTSSSRSAQVEGDGTEEGDEAAVAQPEEAADGEEDLELVVPRLGGRGQQHRADTQAEQGSLPDKTF